MTAVETAVDALAEPCSHQLYPATPMQPAEWCIDDAVPGTDRCERHLYDDENGDQE